jgi:phosphorylase superfamily protein
MRVLLRNSSDRPVPTRENGNVSSPLLARRDHSAPSIFRPENMLREARRQKGLSLAPVAPVCVLDPDGDIVDHVRQRYAAKPSVHWACYHTRMWEWMSGGIHYGIIGRAVGGSFSVMVAEQLFASGCQLLISIASAGQIADIGQPPYWILIERALRDEGTSYHYLPASPYAAANGALLERAANSLGSVGRHVHRGTTWTTDAPFRETAESVALRRREGILAVEMEAAALYAFATARDVPVICLSHVTNQLGCVEGDFEKGDGNGAFGSIELVTVLAQAIQQRNSNGNNSMPSRCLESVPVG